jgi:hypothetical protein
MAGEGEFEGEFGAIEEGGNVFWGSAKGMGEWRGQWAERRTRTGARRENVKIKSMKTAICEKNGQ